MDSEEDPSPVLESWSKVGCCIGGRYQRSQYLTSLSAIPPTVSMAMSILSAVLVDSVHDSSFLISQGDALLGHQLIGHATGWLLNRYFNITAECAYSPVPDGKILPSTMMLINGAVRLAIFIGRDIPGLYGSNPPHWSLLLPAAISSVGCTFANVKCSGHLSAHFVVHSVHGSCDKSLLSLASTSLEATAVSTLVGHRNRHPCRTLLLPMFMIVAPSARRVFAYIKSRQQPSGDFLSAWGASWPQAEGPI